MPSALSDERARPNRSATVPVLLAEGGYQVFELKGGEWAVLFLSAAAALLAIAVGFYLARDVMARPAGSAKMQSIAAAI